MGMDAGIDAHGFHHGNVRFHLAGGGADARLLARVHVHHADVFHSHEAFGTQGGGAEQQVLSHAHGDVAPVAVHIFPVPQAAPYVAHAFLDDQNFRGMEEFVHFLPRDGVIFSHGNTLSGRGGEIDQSSDIFSNVLLVELFVGGFLGTRHICPVGDAEGGPGLLRRRVHPGARKGKHGCSQYRTF